jgi:hypothetical protein
MRFVLEGGYDFRALTASVKEVLLAMTGSSHCDAGTKTASQDAESLLEKVRHIHSRYDVWV